MPDLVTNGAIIKCMFGMVPDIMIVEPPSQTSCLGQPVATINHHEPMVNIPTFGMCTSPANPEIDADPLHLPVPCVPVTPAPWLPGCETASSCGIPLLTAEGKLICDMGGEISIVDPGMPTATGL